MHLDHPNFATGFFSRWYVRALPVLICLPVFFWPAAGRGNSNPAFYLATDRSFSSNETPYVNLEAPGQAGVEFRVYRVRDPRAFILKQVQSRLVNQADPVAMGNPFALFQDSLHAFRSNLVTIARSELNPKTRKELRLALELPLGLSADKNRASVGSLATPALRTDQEYLRSFRIPTIASEWSYRRVPVPVEGDGIYLVEAVSGSHMAATVLVRSSLTFLTKQSDRGTVIFCADSLSGAPVQNAQVDLYDPETGARIGGGTTNSEGIVRHAGNPGQGTLVVAQKETRYAISDPDFFSSSFFGQGGPRVLLYTDRPIYRPGDSVFFKAIARNFSAAGYKPLGGAARISVVNDQGTPVLTNLALPLSTNNGTADGRFDLPDSANMIPGTYNLILTTANRSFSSEFRVDEYRKPKFRVRVTTQKSIYEKSDDIQVRVSAGYYYGKALSGARANVRVFRAPRFDYSPVGQINFEAATRYLGASGGGNQQQLVLDQNRELDSDGVLTFSFRPEQVEQDYTYSVLASITTEDATITGTTNFAVNRSPFYLRVRRENQVYGPGETAKLTVQLIPYDTTLNAKDRGKLIANRPVEAVLYSRGFYNRSEEQRREKILETEARTDENGNARLNFKVPSAGHYVIELTAAAPGGQGKTSSTVTLWSSGRQDTIQTAAKDLVLTASKDLYQVGETAEVLIVSPVADTSLFISLEGDDLYHQETVQLKGNTLRYRTTITSAMSPNFVLSATLFHGGETYKSELKVVAPPIQKFLNVSVKANKAVYRPGDTVELTVRTNDFKGRGTNAEVSLGVVDMALYQLQDDPTPDLARFFYHPRRNNVLTTLSSAYRFFGYSEEKRLQLALNRRGLPDALTAIKADPEARRNFKDQTFWNAKIQTDAAGVARVSFRLADNLTEWKVTARAITPDTSVGETTTTFVARKDLQIQAGIPPYLLQDRQQTIAASVSNLTKTKQRVTVTAAAENGTIQGAHQQVVELQPGAQAPVYFAVHTGKATLPNSAATTTMRISLDARSENLRDSSEHTVVLKPFGLQRSVMQQFAFQSDDAGDANLANEASDEKNLELPSKFAHAGFSVRVTPASGMAVRQSLAYLADYPYGCIEQTMSRFVPLIAAKQAGFISPHLQRELPTMVEAGLARIRQFQYSDGGFGWYSPDQHSDPMMTAYVYRALAISRRLGFQFENGLLDRSRAFLYNALSSTNPSPFERAYIMFALSEGAPVEKSMVDALTRTAYADGQTDYGRALIALTLHQHKRSDEARKLVDDLVKSNDLAKNDRGLVFAATGDFADTYGQWENDAVELTAALLQCAVRLKLDASIADNLATTLLVNRTSEGIAWKNSRDTASSILALTEQLQVARANTTTAELTILLNGKPIKTMRVPPGQIDEGDLLVTVPDVQVKSGANLVKISKSGGPAVFVSAVIDFYDRSDTFRAESRGLGVSRSYAKVSAQRDDQGNLTIDTDAATRFRQGDLVMVSVRVKNDSPGHGYYQVTDAIPPGFSFVAQDGEYYGTDRAREYHNRHIYDDRAVFFIGDPAADLTIRYFIRANLPGMYRALPAKAAFMYYPEIYGTSSDQGLNVAKQ